MTPRAVTEPADVPIVDLSRRDEAHAAAGVPDSWRAGWSIDGTGNVTQAGLVTVRADDLAAVYEYARQFDVDSDPAMQRVARLLGLP
jgi:hypothetical protein